MSRSILLFVVVSGLFAAIGCGNSNPVSPSQAVTSVSAERADAPGATGTTYTTISPQSTIQMIATATLSDGTKRTVTSDASWTSSNSNLASVNGSGFVTVNRTVIGSATISASYKGVAGTFRVSVQ